MVRILGNPGKFAFVWLLTACLAARADVAAWHQAGIQGQGVKVVVLDRGFLGYRTYLGKTLPAAVKVRSFRTDANLEAHPSQHGIRCAEIVHQLAPRAELLFVNWEPDEPETFLQAVRWAREQGAQILTCSLNMPNWSDGAGGGPVHRELRQLLGDGTRPGDMLLVASVGNFAQRHWRGSADPDAQGQHQWSPGVVGNPIEPWGREPVTIEVYGDSSADMDLIVQDGAHILARTRIHRGPKWCQAVVSFTPLADGKPELRIQAKAGAGTFHVVALGAFLRHGTSQGSIVFPADGQRVLSLGAVDARKQRWAYSSCGEAGRLLKPDLMAQAPFLTPGRVEPFSGTSSASPQGAALAALVWSRVPTWSPSEVKARLLSWAEDLSEPGPDAQTGHGLLRIPKLVSVPGN